MHNAEKNTEIGPAQKKQRKQLILTNSKNIFTYRFQPVQRLQPKFMTFDIINFLSRQEQGKQLILTNSKIFLLTVSNE